MDLHIEWKKSIVLASGEDQNLIYKCDFDKLPEQPGIYVFGREHGKAFEALYVGKAISVKKRINTQLQNVKLMKHVEKAKTGKRILLIGCFKAKRGQQTDKCLRLVERALIRYFLSEAHNLVNIQGTLLRQHSILSIGQNKFIPAEMLLDG